MNTNTFSVCDNIMGIVYAGNPVTAQVRTWPLIGCQVSSLNKRSVILINSKADCTEECLKSVLIVH